MAFGPTRRTLVGFIRESCSGVCLFYYYWIKRFNRKETKGRRQVQLVDDALTHLNDENFVHYLLKGIPCKDLAQ
jgi:hypothetical protein